MLEDPVCVCVWPKNIFINFLAKSGILDHFWFSPQFSPKMGGRGVGVGGVGFRELSAHTRLNQ